MAYALQWDTLPIYALTFKMNMLMLFVVFQDKGLNYDPYSNAYKPRWKDHCNLSYVGNNKTVAHYNPPIFPNLMPQ